MFFSIFRSKLNQKLLFSKDLLNQIKLTLIIKMQIYIKSAYIFNAGDTKKNLANLISINCFCLVLLKYRKIKFEFTAKKIIASNIHKQGFHNLLS